MNQTRVCFCSAAKSNNTLTHKIWTVTHIFCHASQETSQPVKVYITCNMANTLNTCCGKKKKKKICAWGELFLLVMSWVKVVSLDVRPPSLPSLPCSLHHTIPLSFICPLLLKALHSGLFLPVLAPPRARVCSSYKVMSKECLKKPHRCSC